MATAQTELTTAHTERTAEQTELIEKLNCLEFEASQLNRAYKLWRSCVEQGTPPDWMAAAIRITYDALITFYLEVSTILADGPHTFSTKRVAQLKAADCDISGIWEEESTTAHPKLRTGAPQGPHAESSPKSLPMTESDRSEQTELIEKLNCLEFETSQLNRAYKQWRSYVEQGTAPDWMAAAIKITYYALITFCLEVSTILADVPHAFSAKDVAQLAPSEASGILEEETTTPHPKPRNTGAARGPRAESSPELLPMSEQLSPMTEPDRSALEVPAAISPPSTADTISKEPAVQQGQEEDETDVPHAFLARHLPQIETSDVLGEESTTAHPKLRNTGAARGPRAESSPELSPMTEPDWSEPEVPAAISPPSTADTISEPPAIQPGQQDEEADIAHARSETHVASSEAADCEISGIGGEESTTAHAKVGNTGAARGPRAEPSPELSPMTEPDWSQPEVPAAIFPPSTADTISEPPTVQQSQQDEAEIEPAVIRIPATLAKWLQGSSNGMLFLAAFVAILIIAGGVMGIYLASPHRAAPATLSVQNSAAQPAAGTIAIPTGEKAGFNFDPDPVVAPLGSSFVLNAVLSRGSDIASVAAQIDYDANLLQFMGVSQGGFLVKDGQQAVLAQRDDPLTGVVRISAEKAPGKPGISGDGPVFALSFQARKRGMATVSIVPGAHDSQGRRVEMTGSQVSVRVN